MEHVSSLPVDRLRFTRREALACGETDQSLQAAVRAGMLVRLRYGVYARTGEVTGLDERERHLLLAGAAVSQQRGAVALAGVSAALLHGFDVFGHDLRTVHLARLDNGSARRQTGIVQHRVADAVVEEVERHGELLVVSPADAVWQVALTSGLEGGVVTADSALHRYPDLAATLSRVATRCVAQPRSRTARLALRLARPQAESVGESLTRIACFRHSIPEPRLQHDVWNSFGRHLGRTDFYWEQFGLLGEFDGRVKYGRLLGRDETATDAVVREKRREDAMRATSCGMARFTWSEVQPGSTHTRMLMLRHELEQSRRLYVRVAG